MAATVKPTTHPPISAGALGRHRRNVKGWHIALVGIGLIVAGIVALPVVLWTLLAISLTPRPWNQRTTPLPALHVAVEAADLAAIDQRLQAGDSVDLQAFGNARWPDGTTPLMIAASRNDIKTTEALLDRGASIELAATAGGQRAIHLAASGALEALLRRGADINARNQHGQTPLICAAIRARTTKDTKAIRLLLDAGADVNARENYGRTVIDVLRTWPDPDPEVIRMLENAGGR